MKIRYRYPTMAEVERGAELAKLSPSLKHMFDVLLPDPQFYADLYQAMIRRWELRVRRSASQVELRVFERQPFGRPEKLRLGIVMSRVDTHALVIALLRACVPPAELVELDVGDAFGPLPEPEPGSSDPR